MMRRTSAAVALTAFACVGFVAGGAGRTARRRS